MRKQAFTEQLKKLWNPNYGNPLFGEQIARMAREKGLGVALPTLTAGKEQAKSFLAELRSSPSMVKALIKYLTGTIQPGLDFWKRLGGARKGGEKLYWSDTALPRSLNPRLLKSIVGGETLKGMNRKDLPKLLGQNFSDKEIKKLLAIGKNKELEAKYFPDIGRTENLAKLLRKHKTKDVVALLNKMFRKGYVVKKNEGFNTIASRGTETPGIYFSGDRNIADLNKIPLKDAKNWVVQKNKNLVKALFPTLAPESSGLDEFRVHVVNGKVVPYATRHRGGELEWLGHWLSPWRTSKVQQVEDYTQKMLKKIKDKTLRKGNYALDIAFDNKGKPQLIETNPGVVDNNSAVLANDPTVIDAVSSAIKGELPTFEKIKRIGAGGAALGAGALAYNKLKSKESENSVE